MTNKEALMGIGGMEVLTKPDEEIITRTVDEQDHDRLTHIIVKSKGDPRSAEAILTEARVMGTTVTAYCGKVWIPEHNPERYPVCETCIEVWESISGRAWPGRR